MKPAVYHVISHTHWDREWYLTFEQFRVRLVDLIDNLLQLLDEDPDFKHFHLDGQTIIIEDYLAVHPHQKERLERHIRSGRILIGPWYLQNDTFLTSGEATIRNLQRGIITSRDIHEEMKVGYLPDQFGNISQLPQILSGFGIRHAVFGRGYDIRKHSGQEFVWEGADGSRVNAIFLQNWYNNAQRFPEHPEKAKSTLEWAKIRIDSYRKTSHYLLMNGVDHLEAQENLSGILAGLRRTMQDGEQLLHSTLPEYADAVAGELTDPYVRAGEMREGGDYLILAGTLSSRVYLKQANVAAQDLLEKWLEPLYLWNQLAGMGTYDMEYMDFLWKELMKNHPHDSICGCSQDRVHEQMMDRYAAVTEAGEELYAKQSSLIVGQIDRRGLEVDDQLLVVFNPAPLPASRWLEAQIDFLEEDGVADFKLEDSSGNSVPYTIIGSGKSLKQRLSPINLPTELQVDRVRIGWLAQSVPGQGYTSYRIVPGSKGQLLASEKEPSSAFGVLENEHLKVSIRPDGALSIVDKRAGVVYDGVLQFADDADNGDLYEFRRLPGREAITTEGSKAEIRFIRSNSDITEYEVAWDLLLPEGLQAERNWMNSVPQISGGASQASLLSCRLKARVSLVKGSREITIRATFDNRVSDHRLRVRFPLNVKATASWAGGQFDIVERPASLGVDYDRQSNSWPNWKWVAAGDGKTGIAVYNRGLHEYEITGEGEYLELTLLRSVGRIFSRNPHEFDDNPMAQCPGLQTFEFAIRPFLQDENDKGRLAQEAEAYHHGLRAVVAPLNHRKWAAGRPWVQESDISEIFERPDPNAGKPRLPREHAFVKLQGDGIVLSAVKRQLAGEGTVIRFYNASVNPATVWLKLDRPVDKAWIADLLEQPLFELAVAGDGTVFLEAGSKQIVTVLLKET